jgi:gas vesicle protein
MGKFILGLIVGVVVGAVAISANPNLAEELRVSLANLTAQAMRTAGETAQDLGDAAEEAADAAGRAVDTEAPVETTPAVPRDIAPAAPGDEREAVEPQ